MANQGSLDTRFALLGNSVSDILSREQRCRIEGRTASFTPALTRHLEIRHFENQILRLCLIYESFVNVAVRNNSMLVKAFSSKPLRLVHYSHPMLSDSSIRRLVRQRNISQRCRNQNASLVGLMRPTRLALRGRHDRALLS